MTRPITDEQRQEWAAIHRQLVALAEFFSQKGGGAFDAAMHAVAEPSHPYRQRLAGLREALADFLEMAGYLDGHALRELDEYLQRQLGIGLAQLQTKRLARIAKARARGTITTPEQSRLLKGRFEEIQTDSARAEEATALSALLDAYEGGKHLT